MRVFALTQRRITHHGSGGMALWPLRARPDEEPPPTHVVVVDLEAGGRIGRHPAVSWQLLVVVAGSGEVCGEDGRPVVVTAGQAALWSPGEEHETTTATGLTAVVLETTSEPDLGHVTSP